MPIQSKWHQTTTIEGTWGVDAWVKAGEPTFFKEFGPPGHHVWHGFVRRFKDTSATGLLASGGATVTGKVVSTHMSRPPGIKFFSGAPMTACWVAINEIVTGTGLGRTLYANSCAETPDTSAANTDGTFRISGLRRGQRYQLSVWDEPLDNVIANYEFSVPTTGDVALGDVPVFSWFSKLEGKVFYDKEGTGFPFTTAGEAKPGIPGSVVNIRFRDGSIYQSTATDDEGHYEFPEFFPFFNWMVAETDFTRFKATGATIIPDNGGAVVNPAALGYPPGLWPDGTLSPQANPKIGAPFRIFGGLDGANRSRRVRPTCCRTCRASSARPTSFTGARANTTRVTPTTTAASPASCTTPRHVPSSTRSSPRQRTTSPASRASRFACTG